MAERVQARDHERLSRAVWPRRTEALAAWTAAVREAARARGRAPLLVEMGPELFGRLLEEPSALELPPAADPAQVSEELALVLRALEPLPRAQARAAARAVAELQRAAAEQLERRREESTRALERVLAAPDTDRLLERLLESAPALHSCALYSWRGGALRREAAAGLAHDLPGAPDALVALAARVREPASTNDASQEQLLEGSPIAAAGLRALTALPLVEGGALAGALEAGSRTAWQLGELDGLLLRAAASRAGPLLAQEEARRRVDELERRLALQNDLARILSQSASIEEAMRGVLGAACTHLGWDAGAARVLEPDGTLRCRASWSREEFPADALQELCAGADGLPAEVVRTGEPQWTSDLAGAGHPRAQALARAGLRTAFVVPMGVGGETLGALELFSRSVQEPARRQAIETLGRQVGQFLRREASGWKRAEVLGEVDPFLPAEAHVQAQGLSGNDGQVATGIEIRRPRKDGTQVDLSISVAPLRTNRSALPGTIAIAADITEQKRAQSEAAETARFREHFVAIVGHDLRNPLTAILSAAQLLLRHGGLSERQARTVARIAASSERMARMIGDLLDFTRSRLGGGFPIQTRRMGLRELCEAVIEELELAYPERTIELEARGDAWGNWDPDRIAQVISNLVGNALQHSPESGTVRVDLRDEGDRVLLETSNAGPPIPQDVLPHLFEPGRRGPPGRGRKESSGLGLGLYIVQQIVLAHGGAISVRSSAEEGTTFTVSLPRRFRALG
ncbi:MAG TPA: GAF domain-containing sensor histidine kinase [Myxococcales bacterium]|nr:GAF domain-containing sensor histidine kinase [Myxococcales bacterium]